ncbi:hypothetical protein FOA52_010253 [Chlamydomonas sp. UWO 241]|nr:hypothetical protein FOA52_010253 [Chlamydomonas sp. UWO 241]
MYATYKSSTTNMAVPGCKRGLLPMAGVAPRQIALKRCKYADAADVAVARTSMDGGADTSDYECSVCLSLLVDPVVGQCGHDFCKSCLDEWRASFSPRGCVSCPICRQPAMAPGVTSLGICVRIQKQIQAHFPEQLEARRQELEVAAAEREAQRARQIEGQVASVQQLMRARFHAISGVLRSSVPAPESDIALRQSTAEQLVHVLHRLRPDMETTFRHRLPNLVRKLEEGLYCTAGSREAYADVTTLEARLQNLVRRLTVPRQQL